MNLSAYANIENLESVMKENGISVPRLRGLLLMSEEETVELPTRAEIEPFVCRELCLAEPTWKYNADSIEISDRTIRLEKRYITNEKVNWHLIHGKRRRQLKFAVRKELRNYRRQVSVWNKYVGRNDVLYIHARIGGNNWKWFGGDEISKQPWFLEKFDDPCDSTYCDIYAKINLKIPKIS